MCLLAGQASQVAMEETRVQSQIRKIPGEGNGNPLHYSCLENPKDRGAWKATVHGVAGSDTSEATAHTHTGTPKYLKQNLTDTQEYNKSRKFFNTSLTSRDRSSRPRINKATEVLNDPTEELDLTDIFMALHPKNRIQAHMEHSLELVTS